MDPDPASFITLLTTIDFSVVSGFALLLLLLICSGLISGAEVALFSLTRTDLDDGLEQNSKRIQIISKLLERPKKLLATILVSNNFINIAIVILFAYLGDFMFGDITNAKIKFVVEVVVVTFLILLFGEILPKIYASRNRQRSGGRAWN